MKANELRIGNLVNVIGITPVRITPYHILDISDGDMQYSPIQLNEEWLVKMGFFYTEFGYRMPNKASTYLNINQDGISCYLSIHHASEYCISYGMKYVHEIQNLHYALTNTEIVF